MSELLGNGSKNPAVLIYSQIGFSQNPKFEDHALKNGEKNREQTDRQTKMLLHMAQSRKFMKKGFLTADLTSHSSS
jgi:predicted lactoylglutathione lyase